MLHHDKAPDGERTHANQCHQYGRRSIAA